MKDLRGRIIAGILVFIGVFSVLCIAVVITRETKDDKYHTPDVNVTPVPENMDGIKYDDYYSRKNNEIDEIEDDDNIRITGQTKYIIETFYVDEKDKEIDKQTKQIPAEFISMNEDELDDYLEKYVENMPLEEYLDGLISYEIISFSEDEVKLRKTYASSLNDNEYYISDVDGEIVVFYSDKDTVYEYTGIKTDTLEPDEQVKVKIGYYIKDEEELYGMLESYSS